MNDLYKRCFARLMALGDSQDDRLYGAHKRTLFADLKGTVLEIGPGTGVNLPYYPDGLRWIGVEPNRHMHPYIREQAAGRRIEIELRTGSAEALGVPDESVDTVVSTLVLCSVPRVEAALLEIRRVLKPGGRLLFIEHVAAPEGAWLHTVQRAVKPVWRLLADGCHPDRETDRLLQEAGFAEVRFKRFRADLWLPITPHIIGTAVKG